MILTVLEFLWGLIIIIITVIISIFSCNCNKKIVEYQGSGELHTRTVGSGDTIVLIPGLGNGIESYNWNMSTEEQRQKIKLDEKFASSLQDRIAELGYTVICFDPPGHGGSLNAPINIDKYLGEIKEMNPKLILGHSIGGRIAQYYGEIYKIPYIMLDPTPDFVLQNINYTKDKEQPTNVKYQKTAEFVHMIQTITEKIMSLPLNPLAIIYSIDDDDNKTEEKEKYFNQIDGNFSKIKLKNATHWVHISNPDVIVNVIKKWAGM